MLGPLLIGAGALLVVMDLLGRQARGSPAWSHAAHAGLWLGLGNLVLGYVILRAARTGRDPYAELGGAQTDAEEERSPVDE